MKSLNELGELQLHSRDIAPRITPWLKEHEAIVISGGRRTGKTSLMYLLGRQMSGPAHVLDMEVPEDRDIALAGPDALEQVTGGGTVFIDEIQHLPDFPRFIKLCVDYHPRLKLVVSGSSSLAIARGFSDELVGRIVMFELSVLSFREYLDFRGYGSLAGVKTAQGDVLPQVDGLFSEYLQYGGYPRVALLATAEMKMQYLGDLIRVYAQRDVDALTRIGDEAAFERFIHAVSASAGSMVSVREIASDIGVSDKTLGATCRSCNSCIWCTWCRRWRATSGPRSSGRPSYTSVIPGCSIGLVAVSCPSNNEGMPAPLPRTMRSSR